MIKKLKKNLFLGSIYLIPTTNLNLVIPMFRVNSAATHQKSSDRETRASSEPPPSLMNKVIGSQGIRRTRSAIDDEPTTPLEQIHLHPKSSALPVRKGIKPSPGFDEDLPDSPINEMPSRLKSAYTGRIPTSGDEDDDDANEMQARLKSAYPVHMPTSGDEYDEADDVVPDSPPPGRMSTTMW
jgi:hypothetical protein